MTPKSPNKNIVKNIDKVDVDLKFDDDAVVGTIDGIESKTILRTWVNKDRFPEFHNGYNDSQENSSLTQYPEVQFRVNTTIQDYRGLRSVTAFTNMTTVYGGNEGIKLFLENQIMESVYRWGDSANEILPMEIQISYINKKSVIKDCSFRETKM